MTDDRSLRAFFSLVTPPRRRFPTRIATRAVTGLLGASLLVPSLVRAEDTDGSPAPTVSDLRTFEGWWSAGASSSAAAPSFEIVHRGTDFVEVLVRIPGLRIDRGADGARIEIPSTDRRGAVGRAGLPAWGQWLALPVGGGGLRLDVLDVDRVSLRVGRLAPMAPPRLRDGRPAEPAVADAQWYRSTVAEPNSWATLGGVSNFRGHGLQRLDLQPVRYVPASGKLEIARSLRVRLSWRRIAGRAPTHVDTPEIRRLLARWTVDLESAAARELQKQMARPSILMIVGDRFLDTIEPFVRWKTRKGFDVRVRPMCSVGESSSDVAAAIASEYADDPELTYVILVGGDEDVPTEVIRAHQDTDGWGESDYVYSLLEGDDDVGDVLMGRMPARSEDELRTIIERVLIYERELGHEDADDEWVNRATGIASSGQSSLGLTDIERVETILKILERRGFESSDRFYEDGWHNEFDIVDAVNEGRSWVLFMGHGSGVNWTFDEDKRFNFGLSHLLQIQNTRRWPFVADCSCTNGDFKNRDLSFAEAWMWNGTPEDPYGAAGMLSSTILAAWDEPATMEEGMVKAYIEDGHQVWGESVMGGHMHMEAVHGSTSTVTLSKKTFLTFGDPSMEMRARAARRLDVDHRMTIDLDNPKLRVDVFDQDTGRPVPGVRVSLSDQSEIRVVASARSDSDGRVEFLDLDLDAAHLHELWVTGFDIASYGADIEVEDARGSGRSRTDDAGDADTRATTGVCDDTGGDETDTAADDTTTGDEATTDTDATSSDDGAGDETATSDATDTQGGTTGGESGDTDSDASSGGVEGSTGGGESGSATTGSWTTTTGVDPTGGSTGGWTTTAGVDTTGSATTGVASTTTGWPVDPGLPGDGGSESGDESDGDRGCRSRAGATDSPLGIAMLLMVVGALVRPGRSRTR